MSKQFIYLTGILVLLMASAPAVSAQENMTASSVTPANYTALNATLNATLNMTTNEAGLNSTTSDLALNETQPNRTASNNTTGNLTQNDTLMNETALNASNPALDVTTPEAAVAAVEPASNANAAVSEPDAMPMQTSEKSAFGIGSGRQTEKVFVVNGNAKPKETFEAGIPIKPVRDVSKMFFVCDIV